MDSALGVPTAASRPSINLPPVTHSSVQVALALASLHHYCISHEAQLILSPTHSTTTTFTFTFTFTHHSQSLFNLPCSDKDKADVKPSVPLSRPLQPTIIHHYLSHSVTPPIYLAARLPYTTLRHSNIETLLPTIDLATIDLKRTRRTHQQHPRLSVTPTAFDWISQAPSTINPPSGNKHTRKQQQ